MSSLEQSILTTISFFDAMSLPVTSPEIYFNLIKCEKIDYLDFLNILENSEAIKSRVNKFNGMYSLKCDDCINAPMAHLYNRRQLNYRMAIKKWIILRRLAKYFDLIPFIKAAFAGGSITRNNTSENSDIDIFIVAKHGRIWTTRASLVIFYFMGKYRHKNNSKDKLCFNHFISDKDLGIKHKSIYTAELYSKFIPLLYKEGVGGGIFSRGDKILPLCKGEVGGGILNNFRQSNSWLKEYLPLWPDAAPNTLQEFKGNIFFRFICGILEFFLSGFIGDFIENIARRIQQPKIAKGAGKPNGRVIFTDEEIELHPDSPERKVVDGLNERLREMGIKTEWEDSGLITNYELRITNEKINAKLL